MSMFPFTSEEIQEHFISAEQLMRVCDQVWSADSKANIALDRGQPRAGSSIYCKVDHLIGLFDHRKARNCVVLVSSESDRPINDEFLAKMSAADRALVQHKHSNEGRTVKPAATWPREFLLRHYFEGAANRRAFATIPERPCWLYVNFRTTSNPAVREPTMHHFRSLRNADWLTVGEGGLGFETFLNEMTSHRFVLCPPGNGSDTHRLWEALYSRTIPVALAQPAMDAFRDLPILFVEDFRQLTRDFLASEYERITSLKWNWRKALPAMVARANR